MTTGSHAADPLRRIDAVAFDYGNVLSLPQDFAAVARLVEITDLPAPEFARRYAVDRLAYDRAELTATEYWTRLLRGTHVEPSRETIAELAEIDVGSWLALDHRLVDWARRLRASGVATAILSNMPPEILAGVRARGSGWLPTFATAIFSCECGAAKPDAAIYRALLDALRLPGERVLFIDDVEENVVAARATGIDAIHFTSFAGLAGAMRAREDALPGLTEP